MPTVILDGYTQFFQKTTLAKLIKATSGCGLKQAKDEVERLLDGEACRFKFDSIGEAQVFLRTAVEMGVLGCISGEVRKFSEAIKANDSVAIVIGANWVKWREANDPVSAANAVEIVKARRILEVCQGAVDAETSTADATDVSDGDDASEIARFTGYLQSLVDERAYSGTR